MYYAFFGLTQPPFKITPDTDFFFDGGNRGAMLEALIYAISHGEGIIKVTGEVGSGKTMLCRVLQARLPQSVETVYLANPSVSPEEILHAIAFELQLPIARDAGRLVVMHALNEYLLGGMPKAGRSWCSSRNRKACRSRRSRRFGCFPIWRPSNTSCCRSCCSDSRSSTRTCASPRSASCASASRTASRWSPLNADEVRAYIAFRLRAAGYHGPDLFDRAVVRYITHATGGLTRRINIVADKAMLAAFAENTHHVSLKHVARRGAGQ